MHPEPIKIFHRGRYGLTLFRLQKLHAMLVRIPLPRLLSVGDNPDVDMSNSDLDGSWKQDEEDKLAGFQELNSMERVTGMKYSLSLA
jgi:hypothetical protein